MFLNIHFIDGRVFVSAFREKGIPVSILTVTDKQGEGGPLLRPYPDWTWYKNDCNGITGSVYQVDVSINIFHLNNELYVILHLNDRQLDTVLLIC